MSNSNYKSLYAVLQAAQGKLTDKELVTNIETANNGLTSQEVSYGFSKAVTTESFANNLRDVYGENADNVIKAGTALNNAYQSLVGILNGNTARESFSSKVQLTPSQMDIALQAIAANAGDVDNVINRANAPKQLPVVGGDVRIVSAESVSSPVKFTKNDILASISRESFDGANAAVATTYAMVLSTVTARPSDMLSLFFPSIVVKHDEHKFRMMIDVANFVNAYDRDRNSTRDDIAKKAQALPILKNLFNPDIMEKDITRVMPYASNGANNEILVPDFKWYSKHTFEEFETGFLKPGLDIDLIGASQSDVDMKKTPADNTDALLPTIKMESMLVKIKTKSNQNGEDFKFILEDIAGSVFSAKPQGDVKDMTLNMSKQVVSVKLGTTTKWDGTVADLGSVCNRPAFKGYVLKFEFALSGTANTQYATVQVDAVGSGSFLKLKEVYDANGVRVPLDSASIADLVAEFTTSEFVGYTVLAYRANTNFKKTGQYIELRAFGIEFAVNFKNPISVLGSVNNFTGETLLDWSLMQKTITAVSSACNYNGLTAIFKHVAKLKERSMIPHDVNNQIDFNMCNHIVDPYYNEVTIDFSNVDSLKSSDRMDDIQAAVLARIAKIGMDMYLNSNYAIAFEEYYRGEGKKPTLLLGTDILTASYLTKGWASNKIALNNILDLVVVTDIQPRLREEQNGQQVSGIGFLTFTLQDTIGEMTKPELLHFGFQAVSPVINVVIDNKPVNGGIVRQAFVLPRYDFYAMLPIMTSIKFTGYSDSIDKIAVHSQIVVPKAKVASIDVKTGNVVTEAQDSDEAQKKLN